MISYRNYEHSLHRGFFRDSRPVIVRPVPPSKFLQLLRRLCEFRKP